ncbi:hypothetical protein O181_119735 [Austropuccinia psidii MF-1]|uniref:Uncharacterized protein n=1 Tax=Austropuccinia psidii MF-1 TaxID=1389203 RepID=A0A9Q3KEK2_9BASI|nr:hypothetical protein [Austropuccinia psidii MF-1]
MIQVCQLNRISSDFQRCIPKDIQTIAKRLNISPQLNIYVCFPQCYFLYNHELAPFECGYKDFSQSAPCHEDLFGTQFVCPLPKFGKESQKFPRARKLQNHQHLHSRYETQRFSDWLTWFIPEFEDLIDEWKKQVQKKNGSVSDYQQSLAWKNLYPASQQLDSS